MKTIRSLFLFLALFSLPVLGQIARTGSCSAPSTSCTLSASSSGNLDIVFAFRNNSTTAPSLPSGGLRTWTSITTGSVSGGSASFRIGCTKGDGTHLGTDTWTNATGVVAVSYSGTADPTTCTNAIGANTPNGAKTSTTITYGGITLTSNDNTWIAAFSGDSVAAPCTPATIFTSFTTAGTGVRGLDTNGVSATTSNVTCTVSSGSCESITVELLQPTTSTPAISPAAGNYNTSQTVTMTCPSSGICCYTTDGSTPTANPGGTCTHGTQYSSGFSFNATGSVGAIGSKSGFQNSPEAVNNYTFGLPHVYAQAVTSSVTTGAIDTTGAVILASACWPQPNATLSDSSSNTWVQKTTAGGISNGSTSFYTINPTTSASHTFTCSCAGASNCAVSVLGFVGTYFGSVWSFDQFCSNVMGVAGTSATACSSSMTPSQTNEILVTHAAGRLATTINGGFTILGGGADVDQAYLVDSSATAINPTWSGFISDQLTLDMIAFKPVAASACSSFITLMGVGCK